VLGVVTVVAVSILAVPSLFVLVAVAVLAVLAVLAVFALLGFVAVLAVLALLGLVVVAVLNDIEHRLTKLNHPRTNGQVDRINRTIKETTVNPVITIKITISFLSILIPLFWLTISLNNLKLYVVSGLLHPMNLLSNLGMINQKISC
jgi:type II secretory pathway pseudopilin PulG